MKVLMLTSNSGLMDGINRHILNIAPTLSKLVDLTVCTVLPYGELNKALDKANVKNYSLSAKNGHSPSIFWRFPNILRNVAPDIIHFQSSAPLFERLILAHSKIPIVSTIHGLIEFATKDSTNKKKFRSLLDHIVASNTRITYRGHAFISKGVRDAHPWLSNIITEVAYNPIIFNEKHDKTFIRNELKIPPNAQIIGSAYRFCDVKNPLAMVRIFCDVLTKMANIHAVLIGTGNSLSLKEIKAAIPPNLSSRFHLPGYRSDAKRMIAGMDVFVMTSKAEGMPTTILEAISVKTPVAMWDGDAGLKDIAELNKQSTIAQISPQGDEPSLANSIIYLLSNPNEALSQAESAYEIAAQTFSVTQTCDSYTRLYNRILAQDNANNKK